MSCAERKAGRAAREAGAASGGSARARRGGGSPNAIPVVVELLDFLGAFCRATLRPAAARDLVLRSDFSANAMRDLGIKEGQTLTIGLPPEALRVFDADAAGRA
jgi:hypothetical protein